MPGGRQRRLQGADPLLGELNVSPLSYRVTKSADAYDWVVYVHSEVVASGNEASMVKARAAALAAALRFKVQ